MHTTAIFTATFLIGLAVANPVPGDVNVPISDTEWQNLRNGGLKARGTQATVNQPITSAEWQALEDAGLKPREDGSSLAARDNLMNCGHTITGKGGSNGHGKWIPVAQFSDVADTFCGRQKGSAYVGTDIALNHETSDTYPITLTNQDDPGQRGPAGNIVFAIYNTERSPTYVVDHETCLRAMKGPLGSHAVKRDGYVQLSKRDNCWGATNNDYEGGYYKINGIGAFGSEVYAA